LQRINHKKTQIEVFFLSAFSDQKIRKPDAKKTYQCLFLQETEAKVTQQISN
jgi:hypothetical protein